ncbi:MAG: methyltransferase domain-containing protein [Bryobacteraceae bacterium]
MTEFTGERVIPGEVNDDLWAEHMARYAFASRFAAGKRVLDLGCGTGYGAADLAFRASRATAIDCALEAVVYGREHYPHSGIQFLQASATALPFHDRAFDLIAAFEVIEHLADYRDLLSEARRVLDPSGVFLVSTPNTLYYAESRAAEGPNPFHAHEFEFEEFRETLSEFFPRVSILLQNRTESFVFSPAVAAFVPLDARMDGAKGSPAEAHFFIGVCSIDFEPDLRSFVYVPRASNVLREREHHIRLLETELAQSKIWLEDAIADRQKLDNDLKAEQAKAIQVIDGLHHELATQLQWAQGLDQALAAKGQELAETVRLLDQAENTVIERTTWAQGLQKRLDHIEAQLRMIRESRWLKLGRGVGLGPKVD